MKRNFLILSAVIFLAALSGVHADETSPQAKFIEGNQAYEKGDYDTALQSYLWVVGKDYVSPALFYDLANVYYRRGERGKAVLWFERALRLSPRDPDIQFNLQMARSHLKDEEDPFLKKVVSYFSDKELGWSLVVLSWIFFGLLAARLFSWLSGDMWPLLGLWSSGILLLLCAGWFGGRLYFDLSPEAVVVSPPGEVRNGPGNEYAVGFTVPEGSKVLVLTDRPEWSQVGVPQQGLKGWMPTKDIEKISLRLR